MHEVSGAVLQAFLYKLNDYEQDICLEIVNIYRAISLVGWCICGEPFVKGENPCCFIPYPYFKCVTCRDGKVDSVLVTSGYTDKKVNVSCLDVTKFTPNYRRPQLPCGNFAIEKDLFYDNIECHNIDAVSDIGEGSLFLKLEWSPLLVIYDMNYFEYIKVPFCEYCWKNRCEICKGPTEIGYKRTRYCDHCQYHTDTECYSYEIEN